MLLQAFHTLGVERACSRCRRLVMACGRYGPARAGGEHAVELVAVENLRDVRVLI